MPSKIAWDKVDDPIPIEKLNASFVNQVGDTMTGDLLMNQNKIKGAVLEDCEIQYTVPITDDHVVSKGYLDTRLQGLDSIYVNESGDTMEGELRLNRHRLTGIRIPLTDTDAANKRYVDHKHIKHYTYNENTLQMLKPIDMNGKK